jgi:hypothetical protein
MAWGNTRVDNNYLKMDFWDASFGKPGTLKTPLFEGDAHMMRKIISTVLVASTLLAFGDFRNDATINSVSVSGESQLIVNLASPAHPVPMDLYVIVGQSSNGVSATPGDVKTYASLFLSAFATGNKVDVVFGLGPSPTYRALAQQATIKK